MKKCFLLVLPLFFAMVLQGQNRALLLSESFNGSNIPSGWTIAGMGQNNWSISDTHNAGGEKNELMLQHNPTFIGTSRFVSPAIDLTGKSNVVVAFKHYLDNYSGSHTLGIATTSDGGATWNDAWSETYNADGQHEVRQLVETPDIGQANVQFCIYYTGNCLNIDYWYFDDIVIYNLEDSDGDLDAIEVPDLVTVGYNAVAFRLINKGSHVITSLEASYQFEGHELVTETFAANMEPLAAETFSFTTPTFLEADNYLLTVNLLKINGATDDDPENNVLSKTVSVNIGLTERIPMIEHFSASTCGPCVNVNNLMLQFTQNNPGKFTYTKYPEYFPGNGDPYYYSEVGVRDNYYDVPWVPYVLLDGMPQDGALTQEAFDAEREKQALAEIRGAFEVEGNRIIVTADLMAYAKLENVVAYVTVNEKTTTGNVGTNGETSFHHILMKMLPNANGNTVTINAGEYERLDFDVDLSSTHVEEMDDLEVAVWLQRYNTKEVYNSHFLYEYTTHPYPIENLLLSANGNTVTATWEAPAEGSPTGYNVIVNGELVVENYPDLTYTFVPTENDYNVVEVCAVYEGEKTSVKAVTGLFIPMAVSEQVSQVVRVYPNPSDESVFVGSDADLQAIKVYDISGRQVRHITVFGTTTELDVKDLDGGIYFLQAIYSDGNTATQKMVVTH
ncbi:MAG: T9SS type A sorting domain-containing protein [Bacteroidales bacterium]|nr:T9SS type A sorting domain-containing protein [Bacteroidales bacterium]